MKAQNINFRITMELVEILRLCLDSDKFEDNKSRVAALEDIYIAKEKLMAAKTIIEKWQSSSNEEVTIISKDYLSAIEELLISNSIDEKLFKKKSVDPEVDLALLGAKLKTGRDKILATTIDFLHIISSAKEYEKINKQNIKFYVSQKHRKKIVNYIDVNFENELEEYRKNKQLKQQGEIKTFEMPTVFWAVLILRDFIESGKIVL
jgi:hypothetical protein